MALLFRNRRASSRGKEAAIELMMQARTMLGVDNEVVVSVSQHDCGDPGCCGTRTVILVMRPDQPTEAIKINKPLETVTQADLSDALAASVLGIDAPGAHSRPK
jgi:hypothetical protein